MFSFQIVKDGLCRSTEGGIQLLACADVGQDEFTSHLEQSLASEVHLGNGSVMAALGSARFPP
jgi:hypothetical protein